MKKRLITIIICFLCLITAFAGCDLGTYVTNNPGKDSSGTGSTNPGNPGSSDDPGNPGNPDNPPAVNNDYTVTVYYGTTRFTPGDDDITVVWRNSSEIIRVLLGADGKANAGELEGDYSVYLENLPEKYSYNPGAYEATEDERNVTILITDIRQPEQGTGEGLYKSGGCYVVKYEGTYRAEIKGEGKRVYYEFAPVNSGWYRIESWVNAYEDVVDPYIQRYTGSSAAKYEGEIVEKGGFQLQSGFTKNFRYDVQLSANLVGNVYTMAVMATSKFSEYPVYVDFAITYMGDYSDSYSDVRMVRAKEARTKAANRLPSETYMWADMGTKVFDADNFKYNEDTGFYHYYSMEMYGSDPYGNGAGYGPIVLCSIKNPLPSYDIVGTNGLNSLYTANKVETPAGRIVNYLTIPKVWLEDEQTEVTEDYQDFIIKDYGEKCNSEGYCYLTKELKDFLQKMAEKRAFWTDGVNQSLDDGSNTNTPELKGYYAKTDSFWLFACGFYYDPTMIDS